MLVWILLAAALVFGLFWLVIRRQNELFCIRVESSKLRLVRGAVPPRLKSDLEDVVKRAQVVSGEIRLVTEGGAPRVLTQGLSPGVAQQVRNVIGTWRLPALRNAGRRA
ncbi:MAG: DUF3634 family protein [Polyangiaceae bacterium]|nr:DUF3634 family protein [Polyangiaceae bacterium]